MHINEFQELMRKLYYQRDSDRGTEGTYKWLLDEVNELGDALRNDKKEELSKEFADVIAWLASLANITAIDLESAAIDKYSNVCPKCKRSPCGCRI